ncbi:Type III restriction enzyme, res subunit [Gallibacterium anatis UMN179]|uniref:Type III restriction enzyme, res subunit n=1 Tax=Gallibacterium anatis (strain UMN179) TaxID=1005058 RepID=F4HAG1_GALAU|nr:DEAD/DEAH box helicase family protein [Gallibacterium anatis]AEC17335.1 Type III restriction enzyme, res subunit [Gallibacterium anatis UMN179]
MQLQFETLDYQLQAVEAVVQLFKGQGNPQEEGLVLTSPNDERIGFNRPLQLNEAVLQNNLHEQQNKAKTDRTLIAEQGKNFTVEMETGTGKTYVYLRTIFELNKQYGWQKFVIVVPSVAIREGVLHTLRATESHFATVFDNPSVKYSEYKSTQLTALKNFSQSNHIDILVINIDSFTKENNVINTVQESGIAPIEYIQTACPIVIIDEPQNMETETRRKAIESLNPLFTLRYSATHKNPYNPVYSLNPVQAYELGLVKQIEVDSVLADNDLNGVYLSLKEIKTGKKSWSAKIELLVNDKKAMKKKTITVKPNQDLFDLSKGNEQYRNGFILSGMDTEQKMVSFANGVEIYQGTDHSQLKDDIQQMQIRRTIAEHLQKEKKLREQGIKVLSLFFIDKVDNYRNGGKFAQWFDAIYRELSGSDPQGVHNGYFSQDKKGNAKDTNGSTQADNDTYRLIMKDKERLLDVNNPLRFIFSHSALKEGWDNPNVFQICTLNDTASEIKKRQEIGRGLRLPVNQQGQRIYERRQNILTVIANESYEQFATSLQREIEEECGVQFAKSNIKKREDKKRVQYRKDFSLHPNFQALWERIQYQTTYRVKFEQQELIKSAVEKIRKMPPIETIQIRHEKAHLTINEQGISTQYRSTGATNVRASFHIPDLLNALQNKTGLTRISLCQILQQSQRLPEVFHNPQQFIDLVAEKINLALQQIMAEGVEYHKIAGKTYAMTLFQDFEFFKNEHTFAVAEQQKTIYENYIPLDSQTEQQFAQDCESSDDVEFYFKLPEKFKIPTPLGHYNPDWAVVFKGENKIYFVAETKNTGEGIQRGVAEEKLRESEQMKIAYALKNFDCLRSEYSDLDYCVIEKVSELSEKL